MRRADRLFQIVQLLRARSLVTAERLSEELSVSRRTIYRDIRDLQGSGVPIRGEAGVGYCLERGYELPPMTFNSEEIEALVTGARVAEAWGDPELAQAAKSALNKIEAVLPRALRSVLVRTAIFAPNTRWSSASSSGMGLLRRAIAERCKVHLHYTRADGEATTRTVSPVGLYFWGRSWSLAAWCELRGGWRNFRVDRIDEAALLKESFSAEITVEAFLAREGCR